VTITTFVELTPYSLLETGRFMDEYKPLYSEEDIRTKVATAWLADHGFGPCDISVEYSLEIRLGRKILPKEAELASRTNPSLPQQ
jgi:hypothetical protein